MKSIFVIVLLCILSLCMYSCFTERPISRSAPGNNESYKIDYLFEHDGCKVYRFHDEGRWVYFTNCSGKVTSYTGDSTKTSIQNIIVNKTE